MAPEEQIDGKLALRIAAARDVEAEAELCRRFWPRLRAFGLRRLRNEQDAVDLAQQVLVITLEALRAGQVQEPERIAAFVMGAGRNLLLDRYKVDRRRGELLQQYGASEPSAYEPAQPIDSLRLSGCLEHLPERERSIVLSTYLEEQSGAEIAAGLGLEPGTVRVARHRALKQLLECMGGEA
jgi:RNA polymerase sigma-70 factor (ECF subfamily)